MAIQRTPLTSIGAGPQDLILSFLDLVDFPSCARTCREWRTIEARPNGAWRAIAMRMLPPAPEITVTNYKQWFCERFSGKVFAVKSIPLPPDCDISLWSDVRHLTLSGTQVTCTSRARNEICILDIDWKKLEAKPIHTITCNDANCAGVFGNTLAVGKYPSKVELVNLKTMKCEKVLDCPFKFDRSEIYQLAFNGQLVATYSSSESFLKVWDVNTNALISSIPVPYAPGSRIRNFWFSGDLLYINHVDRNVCSSSIWNARTGERLRRCTIVCAKEITSVYSSKVIFCDYTALPPPPKPTDEFKAAPQVPAPRPTPPANPTPPLFTRLFRFFWPF